MLKKISPVLCLYVVLLITYGIYSLGFRGGFIFDDYPNLQDLGVYGTIDSWDKARAFITNGFSGPTGRPISLATFLINDNTWPSVAYSFKQTNTLIHLLNGALLFWATTLILVSYKLEQKKIYWVALISTSIWLLHPYFVSTTLYVVQRMAQLATLFSLVGVVGYLKGRMLLNTKPLLGYVVMTLSIGFGTILATYSKENGALLPLLILVIEFCNPKNNLIKPIWKWRLICLWLPSIAIGFYILKHVNFSENLWPNRNFNQVERLYSECRIMVEYLRDLFIPQVEGKGLYQDGYQKSTGLFEPITTFFSLVFLAVIFVSAFLVRKKYPLITLAILFFFAAHLIESTVFGLELYFEHRNYLSAMFLFLPIAYFIVGLGKWVNSKIVVVTTILLLSIFSFFTYQRVKLWSDTEYLELFWAKNTPESARAQNALATYLFDRGFYVESNAHLEGAIQKLPNSSLLIIRQLSQKVYLHQARQQDFINTANKVSAQPFDAQSVMGVRVLVEYIIENNFTEQYGDYTYEMLHILSKSKTYNQIPVFNRLIPYLNAKLALAMHEDHKAYEYYLDALNRYNDVEAGLMMVAEMATTGNYALAIKMLNRVDDMYEHQSPKTLKRTKSEYDYEIERLEEYFRLKLGS